MLLVVMVAGKIFLEDGEVCPAAGAVMPLLILIVFTLLIPIVIAFR